jgi:dihydrofolate reductase
MNEWNATGAIVVGRRTAEQIDHWGGDHHCVPIFVPSHRPPEPSVANYPLVTYVTDGIASAMAQAKAAAGDRMCWCMARTRRNGHSGPGCLDELQIHQIPVLFGAGRRLFDVLPSRVELQADRPGDRHAGGHPHPLPHPPLNRSTSGLIVVVAPETRHPPCQN